VSILSCLSDKLVDEETIEWIFIPALLERRLSLMSVKRIDASLLGYHFLSVLTGLLSYGSICSQKDKAVMMETLSLRSGSHAGRSDAINKSNTKMTRLEMTRFEGKKKAGEDRLPPC
jgi:hypothetical protein